MTQEQTAACFNEWMRRYIDEPERFSREIQDVQDFLRAEASGQEPSYGAECAAYLAKLHADLYPTGV